MRPTRRLSRLVSPRLPDQRSDPNQDRRAVLGRRFGLIGPAAATLSALAGPPAATAQWTVTNLHPAGALASGANGGVAGQQVGYAQLGATVGTFRASLWTGTAGSWTNLHPAGGGYSIAYAADGNQQVGEVFPDGFPRASVWSGTAGSWINLHPDAFNNSSAFGVSNGVQVGAVFGAVAHAAMWTGTAASFVDLNPPPTNGFGHASQAYAVAGGRQVGYVIDASGVTSASMWSGSAASWINLHPAGNISSWAYGVDGQQQVGVVRVPDTSSHAALWSGSSGSWVDLHPQGATNSRASGVAGGYQVGYADLSGTRRASIWNGSAASRVDLHAFVQPAFFDSQATSITIEGGFIHVAGFGYNLNTARQEAILWTRAVPCGPFSGDFNGDNSVNTADLVFLLGRFGQSVAPGTNGDLNGDGVVNTADLVVFLGQFGRSCP